MNASFIVTGSLMALGLVLNVRAWPRRRLTGFGFALLALAAAGKIVVGLAPEDVNLPLHELGGLGIPASGAGERLADCPAVLWLVVPGISFVTWARRQTSLERFQGEDNLSSTITE